MDESTIVGWDDTPAAAAALDWALAREAARSGAVTLVHVVDEADGRTTDQALRVVDAMDVAADHARITSPGCSVATVVRHGDPLNELLRVSDADSLLAVGTHARSGRWFRRGWSIGARLAASASGPVAIIPPDLPAKPSGVVVGYDGSPESVVALDFAGREAELRREHVHVVHAWMEPVLLEGQPAMHPEIVEMLQDESQQLLAAAVDRLAERLPAVAVEAHSVHASAAAALLGAGETAGMLVVGSRGLVGVRRILLGSVSHEIVVAVDCPTVVVGHGAHA
jgi:nucleotide-binding universal stress UspA family protein